jgi:elongation factor 2 kinase
MDKKSSQWQQLQNLKEIYEAGFITVEEFTLRKKQLVDQLTGTTTSSDAYSTRESVRKYSEGDCSSATALTYVVAVSLSVSTGPTVVKHSPDKVFEGIDPERAVKYTFDLKAKEWITKESLVKIDEVPFAKGGLRYVHYLTDLEEKQLMVAKISADARDKERKDIYLQDVFMQTFAKEYAMKFNTYNPPKKVDFVNAFLLELIDRPGSPL